jgi:hypothetical protein
MFTDTELKVRGLDALTKSLGMVEAERFVFLMQRDRMDYTKWRSQFATSVFLSVSLKA